MYQYSRAIYRSIKDLIDPYSSRQTQLDSRRAVLECCEQTMERLAQDPLYFAKPDRALFQDIRRYFPITSQAQVAWAVGKGVNAAVQFIEDQIESGALDGGVARCTFIGYDGSAHVDLGSGLDDGDWHDITCSRDGSTVTVTVDGSSASTSA